MEKGIEFLPKVKPPTAEKIATTVVKTVGVPFIILTQIIFLTLLGLHLKLNQDLTTLSASISKQETDLAQAEEIEDLLRSTQSKLQMIATVKEELCYSCALRTFEKITPPRIILTEASLTEEGLSFAAETTHGPSFALLMVNLLEEEAIKEAAITSGSLGKEKLFTFTIELLFNKEKVRK